MVKPLEKGINQELNSVIDILSKDYKEIWQLKNLCYNINIYELKGGKLW